MKTGKITLYSQRGQVVGTFEGGRAKAYELLETYGKRAAVVARISDVYVFGPGIPSLIIDRELVSQEDVQYEKEHAAQKNETILSLEGGVDV